ncbi:MAG: phytanoyl-CoA dioxygenase family protein [Flavobacterium sp.]
MQWTIFEKLWKRSLGFHSDNNSTIESTWNEEIEMLYRLGISMEDTLQYLYFKKPDFESFKEWILLNKNEITNDNQQGSENVLSKEDLDFWNENGYVIVKNAISIRDCEETQNAIWDFLKMSPDIKETWYNRHEEQKGLMLNFSNHPTLNKNRTSLRIQKAYEQLYETTNIYKSIDKVSFNPPESEHFKFLGSPLHWDVSLKLPIPFGLQGLLYLTDCAENDGAFHCVPGFHRRIEQWLEDLKPTDNPREIAIEKLNPIAITGNAGDFIIWHKALPHCASPNRGELPRMVQYLTYLPDHYKETSEWI